MTLKLPGGRCHGQRPEQSIPTSLQGYYTASKLGPKVAFLLRCLLIPGVIKHLYHHFAAVICCYLTLGRALLKLAYVVKRFQGALLGFALRPCSMFVLED